MLTPKRHASDENYRYGFQGQEKDDELKGEGNSLNSKFRMHDPRLGRFFATDSLAAQYPYYSPYQFSGNRVIDMIELEGKEPMESMGRWEKLTEAQVKKIFGWDLKSTIIYRTKGLHDKSNFWEWTRAQ